MAYDKLIYRTHAIERMYKRYISKQDVHHVLERGEVIEDYPDDTPYPSRLVLGWVEDRPLHVVAADNDDMRETIVITAYEPDPLLWEPDFRKRRNP